MNATPSEALRALALGPSLEQRWTAATALLSGLTDIAPDIAPRRERLALLLEEAWGEIGTSRAAIVAGLVEAIQTDPTPLTLTVEGAAATLAEAAAAALALEGEDGVTELLTLTNHGEFVVRKKLAAALSLLGRSARWAVPTLIRFLDHEPLEYVGREIIATLGQIGGREAIAKLEELVWAAQGAGSWDHVAEIGDALERARAMDLPPEQADSRMEAANGRASPGRLATSPQVGMDAEDSEEDDHEGDEQDEEVEEGEEDEEEEEGDEDGEEDPWSNVSAADLAEVIDRALRRDPKDGPSAGLFRPTRRVSLRSALLNLLPRSRTARLKAGEWLDDNGIEETFFRIARTSPKRVVYCCVSSGMASGCWGVLEFRLRDRGYLYYSPDEGEHESILRAWEPADDVAVRRACILSTYLREWRERVLPPAMGEWAIGDAELLQEAILRVLEPEPDAWTDVLERLKDVPEPREASAGIVEKVAKLSAARSGHVRDVLDLVAGEDEGLAGRLKDGLASDEEQRIVVALFINCISKDPLGLE